MAERPVLPANLREALSQAQQPPAADADENARYQHLLQVANDLMAHNDRSQAFMDATMRTADSVAAPSSGTSDRSLRPKPTLKTQKYHHNPGDNFLTFRTSFTELCKYYDWSEDDKKIALMQHMAGNALEAVADIKLSTAPTMKDLFDLYQERFLPACRSQLLRAQFQMIKQKPGESITRLHTRIRCLYHLAYPDMVDSPATHLIEKFIQAIGDRQVQNYVRRRKPASFHEALNIANEETSFVFMDRQEHDGASSKQYEDVLLAAMETVTTNKSRPAPTKGFRPNPFGPKGLPKPASSASPAPPATAMCYQCGVTGHYRRDCPGSKTAASKPRPAGNRFPSRPPLPKKQPARVNAIEGDEWDEGEEEEYSHMEAAIAAMESAPWENQLPIDELEDPAYMEDFPDGQ